MAVPNIQEVNEFNAESAVLQKAAGVDPEKCLKVATRWSGERTPLTDLFPALRAGFWLTPAHGTYLGHDQDYHWPGVRDLHPNFVPVVQWAATIGEYYLLLGLRTEAVRIGNDIDLFVDRLRKEEHYTNLLGRCGVALESVEPQYSYDILAAHRATIQGLREAETPIFSNS